MTVYASIALAWFHQIPTGNELAANPAAADYWTSLVRHEAPFDRAGMKGPRLRVVAAAR